MTTQARIGHGTQLLIADLPIVDPLAPIYTALGEITNVSPPPMTRDILDATHMESPGGWREFIAGLKDGGEMSVDLNFVPGGATDETLRDMQTEGEPRPLKVRFPNGVEWGFDAYCTGYEPAVPVDDKMTATATFKITGEPDFTDPS
jgi:predicted secreted protein